MKIVFIFTLGLVSIFIASLLIQNLIKRQGSTNQVIPSSKVADQKLIKRAWLPWWDFDNALIDASKINFNSSDHLVLFIYILSEDGKIVPKIKNLQQMVRNLDSSISAQLILGIYNDFDGQRVSNILNNQGEMAKHIDDLVVLTQSEKISGLEIDYEYLLEKDKVLYSQFIKQLSGALKKQNKSLIVTIHPKTSDKGDWHGASSQDWQELSKWTDYLVIMAYDLHWENSKPGPIAPLGWVKQVLQFGETQIPKQKIILGVPLYAYDWSQNRKGAEDLTLKQVNKLINDTKKDLQKDPQTDSSYFGYQDDSGNNHQVWTEDIDSFKAKTKLTKEDNLVGLSLWRLGGIPDEYIDHINSL